MKQYIKPLYMVYVGAFILLSAFFLPFASATKDNREHLEKYSESMYAKELNMKNKDAINISMFKYSRIYLKGIEMTTGDMKTTVIIGMVLLSAIALFSILILVLALKKKMKTLIVFNILNFLVFYLLSFDFKDRGVVPSYNYDYGIANSLYYVGAVVILVGAIWYIVTNKKVKDIENKKEIEA